MTKKSDSSEVEKVSCAICRKEIPLSEAMIPRQLTIWRIFAALSVMRNGSVRANARGSSAAKPENN